MDKYNRDTVQAETRKGTLPGSMLVIAAIIVVGRYSMEKMTGKGSLLGSFLVIAVINIL